MHPAWPLLALDDLSNRPTELEGNNCQAQMHGIAKADWKEVIGTIAATWPDPGGRCISTAM